MNRIKLVVAFLMFSSGINAQIKQGTMGVGMLLSGNYAHTSYNSSITYDRFMVSPTLTHDYFIKDNLSIGVQLGYAIDNSTNIQKSYLYYDNYRSRVQSYNLSFNFKKYMNLTPKLALYIMPNYLVNYSYSDYKDIHFNNAPSTGYTGSSHSWENQISLKWGINYFVTSNLSLIAQSTFSYLDINKRTINFYPIPSTFNFVFGVNYFIAPHSKIINPNW